MKRILLLSLFLCPFLLMSQIETVTYYDFETTVPDSFSTFGAVDTTLYPAEFVIDNPGPDGVNGSASVLKYTKGAAAQTWAGFFWDLNQVIDANTAYEVCLDYWSSTTGQILMKFENGNGAQNWELAAANTTPGSWETLCVDLRADSQGENAGPAFGRIFNRMVLFPEFGVEGTGEEVDFYIDNINVTSDNIVRNYDVTLHVDMSSYPDPFTNVSVFGTFNDWSIDANQMMDTDGDGIWSATLNVPQGEMEYKFAVDNTIAEEFGRFEECVKVTDDGQGNIFVNRSSIVAGDGDIGPFCWNTCYACGEAYSITWNVSFATVDPADSGLYVAGGCCFGNSVYELTDPDGDGVYSLTITRGAGFNSYYTFLNGACGDWGCKEDISGQDCADANNFNDRFLEPLTENVVINTCYGQCSTVAECEIIPEVEVTFRVDMVGQTVGADGVKIQGNFSNWQDADMVLESGAVYTYTTSLLAGDYEYLFKNGLDLEAFEDGAPCTITTDDGTGNIFINRAISISGNSASESTTTYCFNTCNSCDVGVNDLIDNSLFDVMPTVSNEFFQVTLNNLASGQLSLLSTNGEIISSSTVNETTASVRIDATQLSTGMYFMHLVSENAIATKRVVVTK